MALLTRAGNITEAWVDLLNGIMIGGDTSAPRGKATKELLNVSIEIEHGLNNIILSEDRDLNYRFMIAEWLWIQAGMNDVESLARYNKMMRKFSDDGAILNGAYGPRLATQWEYILESLLKPASRQAVSTIWTPSPQDSKDIPCTISLQWLLRWDKLHCTVNMRSSDAWLGLPYDYFTFSQLTNVLASRLRVPVGTITMNLASSHLYEENWHEAVSVCVGNVGYLSSPPIPYGVQLPTKVDTIMMLNQVQREYPNSFHLYAKALKRSKIKALEVLRAIDPFKQKGLLSSDVETSGS
jgi:thymidylate synthase